MVDSRPGRPALWRAGPPTERRRVRTHSRGSLTATPEGTVVREREATEPLRKLPEGPTRQERPLKSDCAPLGPNNERGRASVLSRQWRNRRERTATTHVTLLGDAERSRDS
ncbi:hypothetical protein MTO96_001375 [Rhipicephalus appendiculatus]